MMFFGRKRRKATDAAVAAMRPLIALTQLTGGMSTTMWQDPYLMGYLGFVASFFAKNEVSGNLKPEDLGFAMQDAFSTVSNMNGLAIMASNAELSENRNTAFAKGLDDAATVTFYSLGVLKDEALNPLVLECLEIGEAYSNAMSSQDLRTSIAGCMMQSTFLNRVKALQDDIYA